MKFSKLGIVCTVGLLALVGCSSAESSESSEGDNIADERPQLPPEITDRGYLIAADSGSVEPLKYTVDGSDEIIGLIPDLTEAYAEKLGVDVRIERVSGEGVLPGVVAGRYDVALSLGDFEERRDTIDFVDLIAGGTTLMVQSGNPQNISGVNDLCGRSIAIIRGSIQQSYVEEEEENCEESGEAPIDVQTFADGPTATLALESGRVDVFWNDLSVANQRVMEDPDVFAIAGEPQWAAPYGVGVSVDNEEVRDAIYWAATEIFEDGTYHEILAEYGQEDLALEEIEINGSDF